MRLSKPPRGYNADANPHSEAVMVKHKKGGQSSKKGGSIVSEDIGSPAKSKSKKNKKPSKGKQKH